MTMYGYIRVSTLDQVRGSSLEDQERQIHAVAMYHGQEIAHVYREEGVSGGKPLECRPAGAKLLAEIKPGDTIIVAKLDRAFRSAADALVKAESWKQGKIKLIIADMGFDPVTENGMSKMFFGMLALMAEFERDRILERTDGGRRAKRAQGGHIGGSAPFGYQIVGQGKAARLEPVEDQQAAIRDMVELHSGGHSLRAIAKHVEAGYGLKVSHEAVRRIIRQHGGTN
jgi:DNA invertase Pin-like site-specific DNA recombinase